MRSWRITEILLESPDGWRSRCRVLDQLVMIVCEGARARIAPMAFRQARCVVAHSTSVQILEATRRGGTGEPRARLTAEAEWVSRDRDSPCRGGRGGPGAARGGGTGESGAEEMLIAHGGREPRTSRPEGQRSHWVCSVFLLK